MSSSPIRVFVYGTLKNGFHNHRTLQDTHSGKAVFLGKGKTKEKYPLVVATSWGIPFLLNKPGVGHNVEGEIYEVDDAMLKMLDKLECRGVWYDGVDVDVISEPDHVTFSCLCYVINNFRDRLFRLEHLKEYGLDLHVSCYVKKNERADSLADVIKETKEVNDSDLPSL